MKDELSPLVSIEKFAAYLDGNLSEDESMHIASLMESDEDMQLLLKMEEGVGKSIECFGEEMMDVPQEMLSFSFELPNIDNDSHKLIDLSPKHDSEQCGLESNTEYEERKEGEEDLRAYGVGDVNNMSVNEDVAASEFE